MRKKRCPVCKRKVKVIPSGNVLADDPSRASLAVHGPGPRNTLLCGGSGRSVGRRPLHVTIPVFVPKECAAC